MRRLALPSSRAATSVMFAQWFVYLTHDLGCFAVNDDLVVLVVAPVDHASNYMPPTKRAEPLKVVVLRLQIRLATFGGPCLQGCGLVDRDGVADLQISDAFHATAGRTRRTIRLAQCRGEIGKRVPAVRALRRSHAISHSHIVPHIHVPRRCRAAVPVIHPRMTGRTRTEEVAMPEPSNGGVKTLAIRLEGELHARLTLVAQLDGLSITDAIRRAIETYIDSKQAEGDFATRAAAMLDEIDREAAARCQQLEALLGRNQAGKSRVRRGEESTS